MSKTQQTIVFNLQANIDQIKNAASEINNVFSKLQLPQSLQTSFNKVFNKLTEDIRTFEVSANKGFKNLSDTKKAEKNIENIATDFEKLRVYLKDIKGLPADKLLPKEGVERLKKYKELLEKANKLSLKDNSSEINKATSAVKKAEKEFKENEKAINKNNTALDNNKRKHQDLSNSIEQTKKALAGYIAEHQSLKNKKRNVGEETQYAILESQIKGAKAALSSYNKELLTNESTGRKLEETQRELSEATIELQNSLNQAQQELDKVKNSSSVTESEINNLKRSLKNIDNIDINSLPNNLQDLINKIRELSADTSNVDVLKNALDNLEKELREASGGAQQFGQEFHDSFTRSAEDTARMNSEMDQLKSRLTYFFSAMNGIQLFKRAIRSAYDSVKELDAAITEMAVVTDYSINDIWSNIPQYTKTAKELGATTTDVIKSMVLYTQQGLDMAHATELSNETMKMARIAGLDGAEATDLMTAALRGFNMELDKTSAQRVNDVYSNLAANAAANTHEIADAMTRTASIANAAGMEFETTAAFLTQMIETTRESAENLGTAMKTIVARFTEMKKAPGEIVEVEGEEVNVNKVEAALKSVGVQLRDTNGEFRDLDDVFLELSSKWDSLDVMSQRYVATMAAGSRQQSRFIAMMSNYNRTMELTGYATNSAGASQKQFEKTMDSLTSKLNVLHDVWEQFVTSIANQSAIKGVVDLLINFISKINELTEAVDPLNTGWSKLLVTLLGFKGAKGIVNGILKGVGLAKTKTGMDEKRGAIDDQKYGKGFWGAFAKRSAQKRGDLKRPITDELKSKRQNLKNAKQAASLKQEATQMKAQSQQLKTLSNDYNKYNQTLSKAAEGKEKYQKFNKDELESLKKSNLALQQHEEQYRRSLPIESKASQASEARTAALKKQEAEMVKGYNVQQLKNQQDAIGNTQTAINTEATDLNAAAIDNETRAEGMNVAATEAASKAQMIENIHTEAASMTRGQAILGLFSLNRQKRLAAMEALGLASATEVEAMADVGATAAQTALNAAMYACPVLAIVAGIALLTAGLVAFGIAMANASEETEEHETAGEKLKRQMKELSGASSTFSSALQKIKEENEAVIESYDKYDEISKKLKNLIKGTSQYNAVLEEQQDQIDAILAENPEAAKFVYFDKDGIRQISSEWKAVAAQKAKVAETKLETGRTISNMIGQDAFKGSMGAQLLANTDLADAGIFSYNKLNFQSYNQNLSVEHTGNYKRELASFSSDDSDANKYFSSLTNYEKINTNGRLDSIYRTLSENGGMVFLQSGYDKNKYNTDDYYIYSSEETDSDYSMVPGDTKGIVAINKKALANWRKTTKFDYQFRPDELPKSMTPDEISQYYANHSAELGIERSDYISRYSDDETWLRAVSGMGLGYEYTTFTEGDLARYFAGRHLGSLSANDKNTKVGQLNENTIGQLYLNGLRGHGITGYSDEDLFSLGTALNKTQEVYIDPVEVAKAADEFAPDGDWGDAQWNKIATAFGEAMGDTSVDDDGRTLLDRVMFSEGTYKTQNDEDGDSETNQQYKQQAASMTSLLRLANKMFEDNTKAYSFENIKTQIDQSGQAIFDLAHYLNGELGSIKSDDVLDKMFSGKGVDEIFSEEIQNALTNNKNFDFSQYDEQVQKAVNDTKVTFLENFGIDIQHKENTDDNNLRSSELEQYFNKDTGIFGQLSARSLLQFNSLMEEWKTQAGEKINFPFKNLNDTLTKTNKKLVFNDQAVSKIIKEFGNLNFDSAIDAAYYLNEKMKSTDEIIKATAKDLTAQFSESISSTKQLTELVNEIDSETFAQLMADYKIDADEIRKLAEEIPHVSMAMENLGLSSKTLGSIFTALQNKTISLTSMSKGFIEAMAQLDDAEENIEKTLKFVEDFKTRESTTKVGDTFRTYRDSVEQSFERGQFGDQQLIDYTKMILGNDNFEKYFNEFKGNLEKVEEKAKDVISSMGDNFYGFWTKVAENSNLVSIGEGNAISFDFSKVTSLDDFITQVSNSSGSSREMVEAAVADAQTYSSTFSQEINKLQLGQSLLSLLKNSFKNGDTYLISKSELALIGEQIGYTYDEIEKILTDTAKKTNLKIKIEPQVSLDNTNVQNEIDSIVGNITGSYKEALMNNKNWSFDFSKEKSRLLTIGYTEEQVNQIFKQVQSKVGLTLQEMLNENNGQNDFAKKHKTYGGNSRFTFKDGVLGITKNGGQDIGDAVEDGISKGIDSTEVINARKKALLEAQKSTSIAIAAGIRMGISNSGMADQIIAMREAITQKPLSDKEKAAIKASFEISPEQLTKEMLQWETEIDKQIDAIDGQIDSKAKDVAQTVQELIDKKKTIAYTDPDSQLGAGESFGDKEKDGSNDDSSWKNDYDRYYNALKRIEGVERERNKLAKEQERMTQQRYIDEEALLENKRKQVTLLKRQASINKQLADTAAAYLRGDSNGDVWFDEATGTIQTNPNAANYNEEQMEAFNDQKSLMENHYETWKEAKDNLEDIYDAIDELTKVAEFSLEDLTDSVDRAIEVLDNTLTNLDREISRLDRYDSGATSSDYKKRYEQSAQTYADKYNQLTTKKAINEQKLNSQMYSDYGKYINVDWDTKEVTESAEYYAITDPDVKDKVDEFVSKAQEIAANIIDMDNQQEEIRDSLYELQQTLADKSLEFQEKVYDAVIKSREDEITTLNTINDSIRDAASELISSIQKNIQKIRQERSNKKTEEELSKMQSRLDFLRMDTSSGNQKAILDLEKQLEDKEESYTDALIDQKISELQDQNTEAEKQRKRQIEIMETQLELSKENGAIWKAVDSAIKTGFNSSGRIQKGSDLYNMLSSLDEVTKKNSVQFERWFGELNNLAAAYNANLTADLDTSGQMSNTVSNANDVYGENSEYIKSLKSRLEAMNRDGNFNHLMWYDQEGQKMVYKYSHYYASSQTEADAYNKKVAEYQALARKLANARAFYKTNKNASFTSAFNRLYGYDTGGLADYTGLAWLDGTPTSPEMVLSSKDTENFIQLKDILSNVMNGEVNKNNGTNGDYYFEIAINVDKVTSDYDVDQIADRIKQQISDSARYRNVNVINLLR